MSRNELEEGTLCMLDYTKLKKVLACGEDLIPVAVQHADTKELLVIAYVNELALKTAFEEKLAVFWSTSRNELWIKGKTSGDYMELVDVRINCEQNSLLYLVRPKGEGTCHTKGADGKARSGCFYRSLHADGSLSFLPNSK